jgi:hypothetical protein
MAQTDNGAALHASAPGYRPGFLEKIRLVLPCLRQRLAPKRHLFAGPFAGEFGYELMQWQGFVRARRRFYDQVHVLTYPGRDYLYEGCQTHYHDVQLQSAGYGYGWLGRKEAARLARIKAAQLGLSDYDIFDPSLLCTQYHKRLFWRQEFRLFEEPVAPERRCDVVFHFRAVRKEGPDHCKNYAPELAARLVALCRDRELRIGCIGHPDYSLCPPGADDGRSIDLRQSIAAISAARLVAGENSGPMHLANLCGKPTVLWAQDQWRIDFSLRWNPFRVPIYTAASDSCQPAPERVCAALLEALADLRQRTADFSRPAYTLPAQPIAPF